VDLRLQAARREALAHLEVLRGEHAGIVAASESSNADDEHDPEGATIAFERAQVAALIDQAVARVADLDRALALEEAGAYGMCESCGQPIGAERLEARPAARTCISCAR
jgi:RNA polymerase-binding transcription factor DksA